MRVPDVLAGYPQFVRTHLEIERTYGPAPGADLPDLATLPGVVQVEGAGPHELEATYFDTADLVLVRAGVSLRRRTGGDDEGWHLKVPYGPGRVEIREPLGSADSGPPQALQDAVRGWTRGEQLGPPWSCAARTAACWPSSRTTRSRPLAGTARRPPGASGSSSSWTATRTSSRRRMR